MGRKAGVTAEETRAELLRAAATVFARLGYDGASIADITAEAGLSSGPIYTHYGGKAELFAAMLRAHASREVDGLLGRTDPGDVGKLMRTLGTGLAHRSPEKGSLLVEAIVAAKRDDVVAEVLASTFADRHDRLAEVFAAGQASGLIDADVSADAIARLALMLGLGSLLVSALGLPPGDDDEWAQLVRRLVAGFSNPRRPGAAPADA
jgi:AcrR family transcriptional regulator